MISRGLHSQLHYYTTNLTATRGRSNLNILYIQRRIRSLRALSIMTTIRRRLRITTLHNKITTRMSRTLQNGTRRTVSRHKHKPHTQEIRSSNIRALTPNSNSISRMKHHVHTSRLTTVNRPITTDINTHIHGNTLSLLRTRSHGTISLLNHTRTGHTSTTMNIRRTRTTLGPYALSNRQMRRLNLDKVHLMRQHKTGLRLTIGRPIRRTPTTMRDANLITRGNIHTTLIRILNSNHRG